MDNQFTYNPNVDISTTDFNSIKSGQESFNQNNIMNNSLNNQMNNPMTNSMNNPMNNPMNNRMNNHTNNSMNNMARLEQDRIMVNNFSQPEQTPRYRPKTKIKTKEGFFCKKNIVSFIRKLLVITILYVIISHRKITLLMCNNIPRVCITNALTYNVIKGIVMSLIIITTYKYY